jgi:predicted SAM-dependent methyltransferase
MELHAGICRFCRLHLAASRFERLEPAVTELISRPDWIHLGEPPIDWRSEIREAFASRGTAAALRLSAAWAYRTWRPRHAPGVLQQLYASTDFRVFHFSVGDRLEFGDDTFSFAFSEHFFEHLFLDQSIALLRECHRIMRPGAVIRTAVPDADLRTYSRPEEPAYPSVRVPWTHHQKHKSRWNVYSLSEALRIAGFQPRPVTYCTKEGEFIEDLPGPDSPEYAACPDREFLPHLRYLRRLPSLIVDGIKVG